jgi:hypothetical protein
VDNKFIIKFSGDTAQLQGAVQKANATITGFANQVRSMGNMMAAGFAASEIAGFVMDVSKLAGEAEGVRAAFDKLPNSIMMMKELKEATAGTVSELDLMKRSVMAANFGISLKALPDLLEFAAVRAKQTGQSVDYLADSIVTGIGRKSALILDNLGISITAINEELKVTPDYAQAVGNIASRELEKMGAMSENASTKMERLNATWINAKVALGDAANGTGLLGAAIDKLTETLDLAASKNSTFWQKLAYFVGGPGAAAAVVANDFANATIKANESQKKQNELTDTASVLLRDLGLDYEALMNVAGDNVNVMEIWAEMQRLFADRTKEAAAAVVVEKVATEGLNKALLEQIRNKELVSASISSMQFANPQIKGDGIASMTSALDGLRVKNDEVTASMATQRDQMLNNTMAFSEMVGSIIGGSANGAQAMAAMSSLVVDSIGKMIMAQMIQKAIQDKATDFNFFAKLAVIGVAVATASSLLRKMGKGGGGGGFSSSGGGGGGSSSGGGGLRRTPLGERIQLEFAFTGDAGKVLKAQMVKQDRIDSRTRA